MTVHQIQRALMADRWRQGFCLPNYTPPEWWECDVFYLSKAGYFSEFEIKLTVSDFRADASKMKRMWTQNPVSNQFECSHRMKHKEIGDPMGPVQFWYATPKGLIDSVPDWSGLIHVSERRAEVVKPAPRLHRVKFCEKRLAHAQTIPYYRWMPHFLKPQPKARE